MIAMTEVHGVGEGPALGVEQVGLAAPATAPTEGITPQAVFPTLGNLVPWENLVAEAETLRDVLNSLGEGLAKDLATLTMHIQPGVAQEEGEQPVADLAASVKPQGLPQLPVTGTVSTPAAKDAPVDGIGQLPSASTPATLPGAPSTSTERPSQPPQMPTESVKPDAPQGTATPVSPEATQKQDAPAAVVRPAETGDKASVIVEQKPAAVEQKPAAVEKKPVTTEKDVAAPVAPAVVIPQPVVVEAPTVAIPAVTATPAPQVAQMVAAADSVAAAISVSNALATTGEGEIHVQLKADVLDGSSIRLTVKGGDLKILISPATRAAEETFVKHQEAFQTHLAERVTHWRISVGVALWGSRSFGNYRSEDEV